MVHSLHTRLTEMPSTRLALEVITASSVPPPVALCLSVKEEKSKRKQNYNVKKTRKHRLCERKLYLLNIYTYKYK